MRKSVLLVLIVSAVLYVTGCRAPEEPADPLQHFSVLYNNREEHPFSPDWIILDAYEQRRGVALDISLGDDSTYDRFIIEAIEAESPPDIILKVWPDQILEYAHKGLLLPISEYTDRMPYYTEYIVSHDLHEELDRLRLENGKYYILPGYQRGIQVQQWAYRQDLFEQYGLGEPQTYDELLDALVILHEQFPGSTPLTATWGGAHLLSMMGAGYGITSGWSGNRSYDEAADRWEYAPATDACRQMYRFLARSYREGIFDVEHFDQSVDEFLRKITHNEAFLTPTWISSGFDHWNAALAENGFEQARWSPLPVPESTAGLRALPPVGRFRKGLVLPASLRNAPYLDDLLTFIDWAVYSPEGRRLTTWGIEGETYETGAQGIAYLPHMKTIMNPDGEIDIYTTYGLDQLFNLCEDEDLEDLKKPPQIVRFLDASYRNAENLPVDPPLRLSSLDLDMISRIDKPIDTYAQHAALRFITGELDIEQDWDEYLSELERLGYTTLEKIWNAAGQGGE
ncbi:MAG: extracellular solute-binding protein [Spirochaetia bacterium]|nr:extracellular solute-binding protein [Spirochaetia bacterium]